jgi:acyl carrier protein
MSPIVNRSEIHDRIAELVRPLARNRGALESMTETTSILGDLEVNSARLVDLVLAVEDEFGIEVDDDEVDKVKTISDVVELVADNLA